MDGIQYRNVARLVFSAALLSATSCTKPPESITARYVSPATYRNWQCDDIHQEAARLEHERRRLFGAQQENAQTDTGIVVASAGAGTGLIVAGIVAAVPTFGLSLWLIPAGVAVGGTGMAGLSMTTDRREEVSRILGEIEAITLVRREKACPPPPPTLTPTPPTQPATQPATQ